MYNLTNVGTSETERIQYSCKSEINKTSTETLCERKIYVISLFQLTSLKQISLLAAERRFTLLYSYAVNFLFD